MKNAVRFGVWIWLICSILLFARDSRTFAEQGEPPPSSFSDEKQPGPPTPKKIDLPVDVLTDTKGIDVHPYLAGVLPKIKANWGKNIPESLAVEPPIKRKGNVVIGFRLMKNGKITKMELHQSSGDIAKDRAAWAGIAESNPLPPLPSGFACSYVELRIHFYYLPEKGEVVEEKTTPTLPCVTTTIRPSPE
jgi:TonB family protein